MTVVWLALSALGADRLDPHQAMRDRPDDGDICSLCHTAPPTPADPSLQLSAGRVCYSCHPGEDHRGLAQHLDRPSDAALPLVDGRIGCVTCHDPHPKPASPRTPASWWTARFGTGASDGRGLLRGGTPEALCTTCHPAEALP
ncbi:MAG: hypothetical protein R3F59_24535 [Myxococcota bacterium]